MLTRENVISMAKSAALTEAISIERKAAYALGIKEGYAKVSQYQSNDFYQAEAVLPYAEGGGKVEVSNE